MHDPRDAGDGVRGGKGSFIVGAVDGEVNELQGRKTPLLEQEGWRVAPGWSSNPNNFCLASIIANDASFTARNF